MSIVTQNYKMSAEAEDWNFIIVEFQHHYFWSFNINHERLGLRLVLTSKHKVCSVAANGAVTIIWLIWDLHELLDCKAVVDRLLPQITKYLTANYLF